MKKIILTVLITLFVLAAGMYLFISSGSYDISQLTPHNGLTKWMIRTTTLNSIEKRMKDIEVPGNLKDSAVLALGFHEYNEMCQGCHGGPGIKDSEMAQGLYPKPPKIYKHKDDEDPQEFFWIIKNGIKMTSMPAYGPTHSDEKLWAITAFVSGKLNKMSPEEYADWTKKYGEMEHDEEGGDKD